MKEVLYNFMLCLLPIFTALFINMVLGIILINIVPIGAPLAAINCTIVTFAGIIASIIQFFKIYGPIESELQNKFTPKKYR